MRRRQYAPKPAQDTSVLSSEKLLQTRPFQPEVDNNLQVPSMQASVQPMSGGWDLTKMEFVDGPPLKPLLGTPLQAKLTIGAPNDKYEQEADRVAQQVVQRLSLGGTGRSASGKDKRTQPNQLLQRETLPDEEDELQMKPLLQRKGGRAVAASGDLESAIHQSHGGGQPLADSIREPMEQEFGGVDFHGVKVHTDAKSDQLNRSIQAKAFTTGQDIFFRKGAYEPGSRGGQELIAHELTHVVQQAGPNGISRNPSVNSLNVATSQFKNSDPASLIQRKVTLEFSDEGLPLTTEIADIKVDRPSNPLTQYTDKYGPGNKGDELRHKTAWLEYERGIQERVKGKTIRKACKNYNLDESAWSVSNLKKEIQAGADKFMSDLSNYDWGPKLANNKAGSAAPHATNEAISGAKKRKLNSPDKPTDKDFDKAVEKSQFFNFDFVSDDTSKAKEQRRVVKEAKRKRRKSQKLLGDAAKRSTGEKVRVRNIVNMGEAYREDYLGKRGKGVGGWTPEMIIRVPAFEKMSDTDVSDLESSSSEDEYFTEMASLDYMNDIEPKKDKKDDK